MNDPAGTLSAAVIVASSILRSLREAQASAARPESAPAIAAAEPIAISNPALRRHPIMSAYFVRCIAPRLLCFVLPQLSSPNGESRGLISTDKQQRQSAFLTIHKPFRRKRG